MKCSECGSEMLWDAALYGYACLVCCSTVVVPGEYHADRGARMTEAARRAGYLEDLAKRIADVQLCGRV